MEETGRISDFGPLPANTLDAVFDAVLVAARDGTVEGANAQADAAFSADGIRGGLLGRSVYGFFPDAGAEIAGAAPQVLAEGGFVMREARCLRGDGSSFQGEVAIGRIGDGRGPAPLCLTIRDVSVRHKAQRDLRHALERMEAYSRSRMEFVSNVSHELRTPLTSMIYAVRNMKNGHAGLIGERAMQYLERLDADCHRLLGTVNDILDLRQIENKSLTLVKRRIAPAFVAASAAESLQVQACDRGIALSAAPSGRVSFAIADPAKLERVFINVIGNALKFTPSGGSVTVAPVPECGRRGMMAVAVSDTGVGIPPEALPKVTARYFQVGDQPVGTGLGLAITKELLELHGGALEIASPDPATGRGTRVTVFLPEAAPPCAIVAGRGDEPAAAEAEAALANGGIPVRRFTSGHAAVRAILERPPDFAAVCGDSGDMTAGELVANVRGDRRTRELPLIYVRPAAAGAYDDASRLMAAFRIPIVRVPDGRGAILKAALSSMR